ncbi:MAG: aromatic amino acid ammonia-lyase, partial [Epsilonproteobacteria bacterium]|nr:aromatic amino acid ammonia-lyase [Campylobacterota bacterium]
MTLTIDNGTISLDEIIAAKNVKISNDSKFSEAVTHAHEFLMEQIKSKPIYGITTGYGASGKNYVSYEDSQTLQKNLYRFHGCGVGENLSKKVCRYAVIMRIVSLSKGRS